LGDERIGKVKTEASKKSIPLDDVLIEELLAWRQEITPKTATTFSPARR
jgi:hypothetical protein